MRGNLQTGRRGLGAALCGCSGASTPASHSGDSRTPATAAAPGRPAPGGAAAREERAARARLRGGGAEAAAGSAARPARAAGAGPARPSRGALDRRRGGRRGRATRWSISRTTGRRSSSRSRSTAEGAAAAQPLPAHLPGPGQRPARRGRRAAASPGAKNYLELYGISAVAVGAARALRRGRTAPLPRSGERRRARGGRDRHLRRARRHQEGRAAAGEGARGAGEGARARRTSRRWRSWPRSSRAFAPKVKLLARRAAEKPAMAAVERRLTCEGLLGAGKRKHTTGIYDDAMRLAVRRFQQKHMIYEANYLRRKTVDALARPLLDNDYDGLVRALRERVVSAAGDRRGRLGVEGAQPGRRVPEDGAGSAAAHRRRRRRWRSSSATRRAEFKRLRVAIKLPPRPDYYADHMDLSIVVDRGDVWYDLPFDAKGHYKPQPRKKYPSLTLYTKVGGKQVALARWRTTIGGWRAEQAANGYEYFRYKESDVGPRVIRNVVSGPVWIAPASTPIRVADQGQDRQRQVDAGGQLRRARPGLPVGLRARSPATSSSPGRTAATTSTTACARTARRTTCRSTARTASRTAATGCRTTSRSGCTRSSCSTAT